MSTSIKKYWYIIQTFSGFENKVAQSLIEHIKIHKMEKYFDKIMIPTEEILEIKRGNKRKSEKKFFPGYILVLMIMNNLSWHLIKDIPKIMGFIGGTSDKPSHMNDKEIYNIMNRVYNIKNNIKPQITFEPGEIVRINDGPFYDFNGTVESVDYDKNRLKLSVSIFGRATPVELNFNQVEKN